MALACVGLTAIGWRWVELQVDGSVGISSHVQNPADHEGERVHLGLARVREAGEGTWVLEQGPHLIRAEGGGFVAEPGDTVSVSGDWRADGTLRIVDAFVHSERPTKRWLGVLGMIVVLVVVPLGTNIDSEGWGLRA